MRERAIAEGRQIIIFPEGTRRPPLAPPHYRRGVARLYAELNVTCLPVALNSGLYWPRRSSFIGRARSSCRSCRRSRPGCPAEAFASALQNVIETATETAD